MSREPVPNVLPAAFWARLVRIVAPDDLHEVRSALACARMPSLRVNTLRGDPLVIARELSAAGLQVRAVPGLPESYVLEDGDLRALQQTEAHARGAVFVQGLSSQLAAPALAPEPGESLLDLAAAPGGKTCHLAARMGDRGRIVANDRSRSRCFRLRAVLQQQGVRSAEVSCRAGESFGRALPGAFDRVLLDAPCSAEARLRGTPPEPTSCEGPSERRPRGRKARAARRAAEGSVWSLPRIKRLAGIQQRLLESALDAVRPGGVVLYATCTLAPEENEAVLDRVLRARDGEVVLEDLPVQIEGARPGLLGFDDRVFLPELTRAVRILPGVDRDAFFLARLRRA